MLSILGEGRFKAYIVVKNKTFTKEVGVRLSLDKWSTFCDLMAHHLKTYSSKDGVDSFDVFAVETLLPELSSFETSLADEIHFTSFIKYDNNAPLCWSFNPEGGDNYIVSSDKPCISIKRGSANRIYSHLSHSVIVLIKMYCVEGVV